MLKAVPYDCYLYGNHAKEFYENNKNKIFTIIDILPYDVFYLTYNIKTQRKYLKHAVKPKVVKYAIDCRRMSCGKDCPYRDVYICNFTGTKSQVEAHIKRYWKQPKIKAVVK